jgi:hypothetical protein
VYRTSLPLEESDSRASQEPEGGYKACFAVSDDGIHWEKPVLGQTIDGYSAAECDAFTGDDVRHTVTWAGNADLSRLAGRAVRLRFQLQNAALYAFQFVKEGTWQSPANLLAPGAKGAP